MRKPVLALLIPAVLVTGLGLTGCSSRSRWCEYDATDKRVSDKFCKNHVPGSSGSTAAATRTAT